MGSWEEIVPASDAPKVIGVGDEVKVIRRWEGGRMSIRATVTNVSEWNCEFGDGTTWMWSALESPEVIMQIWHRREPKEPDGPAVVRFGDHVYVRFRRTTPGVGFWCELSTPSGEWRTWSSLLSRHRDVVPELIDIGSNVGRA